MIAQLIRDGKDVGLYEKDVKLSEYLMNPWKGVKDTVPLWMFVKTRKSVRSSINYTFLNAIIIEFDNKGTDERISINQFISKYSHLKFALHTTSSHTNTVNKFRVILPLNREYDYRYVHLANTKKAIFEYFPGIDHSCLSNFQKIPALPNDPNDYFYKFNNGNEFSIDNLKGRVDELDAIDRHDEQMREIIRLNNTRQYRNTNYEAYKLAAENNLRAKYRGCGAVETGSRYIDLRSYASALLNAEYPDKNYIFDEREVENLVFAEYKDQSIVSMVKGMSRLIRG